MTEEYVRTITGVDRIAVGHAKVQLIKWRDRDPGWLRADLREAA